MCVAQVDELPHAKNESLLRFIIGYINNYTNDKKQDMMKGNNLIIQVCRRNSNLF